MKAAELRDMDNDALEAKVRELDDQLFRMRFRSKTSPL